MLYDDCHRNSQVGKVKLTVTVVEGVSALDPKRSNSAKLTNEATDRVKQDGTSGHSYNRNTNDVNITMKDVKGTPILQPSGEFTEGAKGSDTAAHEGGGHGLGLPDTNASGTLMGPGSGRRISPDELNKALQSPTTTVIQCPGDSRCTTKKE